jgi:3D (Asp-Asp-Asp) domain-containing protein
MRNIVLLTVCALFLGACAAPKTATRATKPAAAVAKTRMTVRTTAYTHTEKGGAMNAIGGRLRFGGDTYSAASDWSWLPLGTRFRMVSNGRIYVIEDYGSALVGRQTVDLYMPTRKSMNAWGVRHVDIEIIEWGSHSMSLKLLEGRQRHKHVRAMVAALRKTNKPKAPRSS